MFFARLFRDKFDLLLTSGLFVLVLLLYINLAESAAAKSLEYILNSLAAGFFTLVGVRRLAGNTVQADIDTANINQRPADPPEDPPGDLRIYSGIPKKEVMPNVQDNDV